MKIVFASANPNKINEINKLTPDSITILSLTDIGCSKDIPETQPTIEGNASQKASFIYKEYGVNCFADDTGLMIDALAGKPGVLSARYAGELKDDQKNINKVLEELKGEKNRNASFKTVISLIINGKEHLFTGIVEGVILERIKGNNGFGYDPIFAPNILSGGIKNTNKLSFAEIPLEEKNKISHRAIAYDKLINHLL